MRTVAAGRPRVVAISGANACAGWGWLPSRRVRRSNGNAWWSFLARVRDFRKVLVILPASACVGAVSGALWRVAAGRSADPHAVYQALYAEGPEREVARRLGQHTLAGVLTNIFPGTRTRLQNVYRRGAQHALGAKMSIASGHPARPARKRPPPRAAACTRRENRPHDQLSLVLGLDTAVDARGIFNHTDWMPTGNISPFEPLDLSGIVRFIMASGPQGRGRKGKDRGMKGARS